MTIRDYTRKARELKDQRDAILDQRRRDANEDPSMTPKQRDEYIAHWKEVLSKQFAPKFADLRENAEAYARMTKARADRHRPTLDADNAAALVRTEQAWRNTVLPQLEKGRTLRDALHHADRDALLGTERFAPGWLQANRGEDRGLSGLEVTYTDGRPNARRAEVDTSFVGVEITRRLIELTDGTTAADLRESLTIDAELQSFTRTIDHYETGQGSGLDIAVGAALAQQSPLGDERRRSATQREGLSMADAIGARYDGGNAA